MGISVSTATKPSVLAREVWGLMAEFVMANMPLAKIAAEFDLSPPQAKVLQMMDPETGMAMSVAAERHGCDASNMTGLTDRLEARGLIERRPAPGDRRVRMLHLTPEGLALRERLRERLFAPPASFGELTEDQLEALRAILSDARGSNEDH
jgi:DNA-binding MarR family transcriptional regulator